MLVIYHDWVLLVFDEHRVYGLRGQLLLAERCGALEVAECSLHQGSGVVFLRGQVFQLLSQLRFRGHRVSLEGDERFVHEGPPVVGGSDALELPAPS